MKCVLFHPQNVCRAQWLDNRTPSTTAKTITTTTFPKLLFDRRVAKFVPHSPHTHNRLRIQFRIGKKRERDRVCWAENDTQHRHLICRTIRTVSRIIIIVSPTAAKTRSMWEFDVFWWENCAFRTKYSRRGNMHTINGSMYITTSNEWPLCVNANHLTLEPSTTHKKAVETNNWRRKTKELYHTFTFELANDKKANIFLLFLFDVRHVALWITSADGEVDETVEWRKRENAHTAQQTM